MLNPGALWFLALIPPVVLLYFLRLRRKDLRISSTMLWTAMVDDLQANVPFQRLRKNLLLLLQILILLALIGVLIRPFLSRSGQIAENAVLIIDSSASMKATDVGKSRLAKAREAACRMIDDLSRKDQAMVVEAGFRTRVRASFSADKRKLKGAVNAIEARDVRTNLRDALVLALSLSQGRKDTYLYVLSDGAFDKIEDLNPGNATIEFVKFGQRADNVGVTALDVRQKFTEKGDYEIFVGMTNFGSEPRSCNLELYRNGALFGVRPVTVPPGDAGASEVVRDFTFRSGVIEARLDLKDDLEADNAAYAYLAEQKQLEVLLISKRGFFLEKVLNADPAVHVIKGTLDNYFQPVMYDAVVFDGQGPDELYPGSYLLINCGARNGPVTIAGDAEDPTILDWDQKHPVMRHVNLNDVAVSECLLAELRPWARSLVRAETTPLVALGERRDMRVVYIGFDLQSSNLPMRAGFPILMANTLAWLTRETGRSHNVATPTGHAVPIDVVADVDEITVETPDGRTVKVPVQGGQVLFDDTETAGVYRAKQGDQERIFVANLLSRAESDIMPHDQLELGMRPVAAVTKEGMINKEIWKWLALLGLTIMCLEWYVYHRRL